MSRLLLRLLVLAAIAPLVTACGGGGASHGTPAVLPQSVQTVAPQLPSALTGVPQTALRGVLVSVQLPLRNSDELDTLIANQADEHSPAYRHFLTPEQFRDRYAPAAADLNAAAATLQAAGYETRVTSQTILAAASQPIVERSFGVRLQQTNARNRTLLSADRAPILSAALTKLGASVTFSRFVYHTNSKRVERTSLGQDNRYGADGPYWFTDLKEAYGYPSYRALNGAGRTIAIVISSDIRDSDLAKYFGHEGLARIPTVVRRPVNGGPPPFDVNSPDSDEASLDVQQSLGSAPGASLILYDIPDLSDQNILAGYQAVVDENRADIVSSSFGLCELYYTKAYNDGVDYTPLLRSYNNVFRQGNAQGITFVASSGDNGALDCTDPSGTVLVKGVENPADDPNVTAVGGTNLVTASVTGSKNSRYAGENAYFDALDPAQGALPNQIWGSGGGISELFKKPWYQGLVETRARMRTVPDIAMHMGGCPFGSLPCGPDRTSVVTAIGGSFYRLIGTSASAPEFAGLLAVTEQSLGTRLGNANGYIYSLAAIFGNRVYRHPPGNNGYPTRRDYDYVLGNGTPHAAAFALRPGIPLAGDPGTPSNP